jgi:antitoxin VapB
MTGRHAYIDSVDFNTEGLAMPLQIANPAVVGKVERLARVTGLSKTAAVERAVDQLLRELEGAAEPAACMRALLAQLDRIPDRADAFDPLPWDEAGLPE